MTVAASLFIERFPVLISDLMLSVPKSLSTPTAYLPTVHDQIPTPGQRRPSSLLQKMAIINDNMVVCWANSPLYARKIIRDIICKYRDRECSIDEMLRYLDGIDPDYRDDLSLVGMLRYGGLFYSFGFNCGVISNSVGDCTYVAGTGTDDFIKILNAFTKQSSHQYGLTPLRYAISALISIYNYMVCKEFSSEESFIKSYGAGYEIATYLNGRLQKVDDISHILWVAKEDENGGWGLSLPSLIMKYKYYNNVLVIRRAEFVNKPDTCLLKLDLKKEFVHIVSPIDKYMSKIELAEIRKCDPPSFNSRFICHNVLILKRSGKVNCCQELNYSSDGTNPIHFYESKSEIRVKIDNSLIKALTEGIDSKIVDSQEVETITDGSSVFTDPV